MASVAQTIAGPIQPEVPPAPVYRLEHGDHLTQAEFERRYSAMPNVKKAELIEGVVYMPSPVRHTQHGRPNVDLVTWVSLYCIRTPGTDCSDNATVRLDDLNEPQPDVQLFVKAASGGRVRIDDGYIVGAPELAAEAAASSASYDLHAKLRTYQRHGVKEYVVWRVLDSSLDWFSLEDGKYVRKDPDPDGVHRSRVFPGLWLDPLAMVEGNMPRVLEVLDLGLASPEHTAFVAALAAAQK